MCLGGHCQFAAWNSVICPFMNNCRGCLVRCSVWFMLNSNLHSMGAYSEILAPILAQFKESFIHLHICLTTYPIPPFPITIIPISIISSLITTYPILPFLYTLYIYPFIPPLDHYIPPYKYPSPHHIPHTPNSLHLYTCTHLLSIVIPHTPFP